MSSLAESLQKVSIAAYQAADAGAGESSNGTGAEGAGEAPEGAETGTPEGEETVEGEFKEV
jgi:hypothetical protein